MKEKLLDRMIRLYGFEHDAVIAFAQLLEADWPYETLEAIVTAHEAHPILTEEEDE